MAGEPGEQRPRLVGVEPPASHRVGRQDADRSVAGERHRVLRRDRQRRQQPVGEVETGLHERAEQSAVGRGVDTQTGGGFIERTMQDRARAPSSGCATGTSEWIHSRPYASSGVSLAAISRNAGEPRASGWIAEHTSCSTPGSVSSSVRVPPPGVEAASKTVTSHPARASVMAATNPFGPAPTTTADRPPWSNISLTGSLADHSLCNTMAG